MWKGRGDTRERRARRAVTLRTGLGIGRHQKMNLQCKIQKHERLKRLRVNKSPHCIGKSPVDPTGSLREGKKPFAGTPLPSVQTSSMLYFT